MSKQQIQWTLFAFALLAAMLYGSKILYDDILKTEVYNRHQQLLKTAKLLMQENLLNIKQDAQRLALNSDVQNYIQAPTPTNLKKIQQAFIATSNIYRRYDQIRYIDLQGKEKVRIDYAQDGAHVVPKKQLQNKAERYYVQQGLKLKFGQTYLSSLDLNIEHGSVTRPFKPVMRLVLKLFNNKGKAAGLLVINYNATQLLEQFRSLFPSLDRPMLLNDQGYWLLSQDAYKEWGWQLNRPQITLGHKNPKLWESVLANPNGKAQIDGSLYSYRRFNVQNLKNNFKLTEDTHHTIRSNMWVLMVETRWPQWHIGAVYLQPWFQVFLVGLFTMTAALVYFIFNSRQQRHINRTAEKRQLINFKDLYEHAPIGYITLESTGKISNVNHMLLRYLGYNRNTLINNYNFKDLVSEDSSKQGADLLASIQNGEHKQYRLNMLCKDGQHLAVLCNVTSRFSAFNELKLGRCSIQDISQQVELEQTLKHLARCDALTGLSNRRHFDELADREVIRLKRDGLPLAALALDIDHFKRINDHYGHDIGDKVLKALAADCKKHLRKTDIFARFGGEEFVILLPEANLQQGQEKAEILRQKLAENPIELDSGELIKYSISIGVACLENPNQERLPDLLKKADQALYQAKNSGRNRVCIADS